jgi:hypothetical protein
MNLLADRFEALIEFLEELRLKGYNISTIQYMAVQNLLIALAAQGQLPDDPKKLSTLIAPIVCSSPDEQDEFYAEYEQWVEQFGDEESEDGRKTFQPDKIDARKQKAQERETIFQRIKPSIGIVIASLILTPILVEVLKRIPPPSGNSNNSQSNTNGQINSNSDNTNVTANLNINRQTNVNRSQEASEVPVVLTSDAPIFAPTEVPAESLWSKLYPGILVGMYAVVIALPFIWLGAWWLLQRVQQWRLKRRYSKTAPFLEDLRVKGVAERLFRQSELRRAAQQLRKHREVGVRDLAVHASVEATARKAGWFTPVYSPRKAIPEYLVLIDRIGFTDQKARLEDELIDRLVENDIHVSRYYFEGDPRLCRAGAGASYLRLQDLEAKHPNDYLMIFSDGAGLINPLTGRVQRWVEMFLPWTGRALMTPEPSENWSYRERALTDQGFAVLPASSEGITALVRTIQTGNVPKAGRDGSPELYPEILNDMPERWFTDHEPDSEEIDVLRIELQYFLGMEGYYWLCACAVYPALQYDLTLYFGYRLTGLDNIERRMQNLVRLPWFRQGNWPDWLRERLIADLPLEKERVTRQALQELLLSALENPADFALTVARKTAEQEEGRLKRWMRSLSAKARSLYKREVLRSLIKEAAPDSPLRDYVFLGFLSGNKTDRLSVSVPKVLRALLFKNGQSVLGMRPVTALILALGLSFIAWKLIPTPSPPPPPPPPPVLPQFNARPSSGVQGSEVKMIITNWVDAADCSAQSLKDALLTAPADRGLTIRVTSTDDCRMEADISVAVDAAIGPVELAIKRGDEALGAFPFSITETGIVLPDIPELVARPFSGKAGTTFTMVVSNDDPNSNLPNNAPNFDCKRRSLEGAELIAPARSGLNITDIRSDDCRLTATVSIRPDAASGRVSLAISNNKGEIGRIPFRIIADQSLLPDRVNFSPDKIIGGITQPFRITNPDCRRYSLKGASLPPSSRGLVLSDIKVTDCQIEGNIRVFNTNAGIITLVLKKQDEEVPIQITVIPRQDDCPELRIACPNTATEDDDLTIQARVDGMDDENEQLPFEFFIDGEEQSGDAQNQSTLFLSSEYLKGKAGKALNVIVRLSLERTRRRTCALSATCKIVILYKSAGGSIPQSPPEIDIRKVSPTEDEVIFKSSDCLIDRISLTTAPDGKGEVAGRIYFRDKNVIALTDKDIIARLYKKQIGCGEIVKTVRPTAR